MAASDSGDQYGWYKNGLNGSVYFPYNGGAWEGGKYWQQCGYVPDGDTAHTIPCCGLPIFRVVI